MTPGHAVAGRVAPWLQCRDAAAPDQGPGGEQGPEGNLAGDGSVAVVDPVPVCSRGGVFRASTAADVMAGVSLPQHVGQLGPLSSNNAVVPDGAAARAALAGQARPDDAPPTATPQRPTRAPTGTASHGRQRATGARTQSRMSLMGTTRTSGLDRA